MTILERRQRLQVRRRFSTGPLRARSTFSSMISYLPRKKASPPILHQPWSGANMSTASTTTDRELPLRQQQQHPPTNIGKLLWKMKRNYQKRRVALGGLHAMCMLDIDRTTMAVLQFEIEQLLLQDQTRNVRTSPLAMVNALLGSRYLFNVYADQAIRTTASSVSSSHNTNGKNVDAPLVRRFGGRNRQDSPSRHDAYIFTADSSTQRRYDLINTLNQLQQHVSSMSSEESITSWEDAVMILSKVLHLPLMDENEKNAMSSSLFIGNNTEDATVLSITNEIDTGFSNPRTEVFLQRLRDIRIEEINPLGLRPSEHKWLEIANTALLSNSSLHHDDEEPKVETETVNDVTPLFRALTDEEKELIDDVMRGHDTDIVARTADDTDSVQRANLRTLQPYEWVNDEVIHYYLCLLQQRDEQLCCSSAGSKKRSHFFKSFFMTKLLDEGNINPALDGVYNYGNVKRWSKKVPGKDIFNLSKIVFPINQGNQHWTSAIIYMDEQRIQYYDSLGGSGKMYLQVLLQYLQDEHMDKKKAPMKSPELWNLVKCTDDTPRQQNGYDCGVFTCMFADFLSIDRSFEGFNPSDMSLYRQHIALSIIKGEVVS